MSDRNGSAELTVYAATKFMQRLRGLLGYRQLTSNEALLIAPCSDIHTFGMGYPVDVAFIDDNGVVLKLVQVKPNRIAVCRAATAAIEFYAGSALVHAITVGCQISTVYSETKLKPMQDRL